MMGIMNPAALTEQKGGREWRVKSTKKIKIKIKEVKTSVSY
jgi:hypothetical protein